MREIVADNIYALGDTHTLNFVDILQHYEIKDFVLIHVGDAGEGFGHITTDKYDLDRIHKYLEENNGQLLVVRGNHSDTSFYRPNHWTSVYKKITFVPDFTYYRINGSVFLLAGGATSIDRVTRIVGEDYWVDEKFVLPEQLESLEQCDVLITHSTPLIAFPNDGFANIAGWFKNDPTLKEELIKEREDIQKLYEQVNPKAVVYGHFHKTVSEYIDGTWFRCLDINELIDLSSSLR